MDKPNDSPFLRGFLFFFFFLHYIKRKILIIMNSLEAGISCRKCLLKTLRDFPGSPVVKAPSYRGVSLILGRGTKIPRAMPKFFFKKKKDP